MKNAFEFLFRRTATRLVALVGIFILLISVSSGFAQTATRPSGRYLLIVETSEAMRPRASALQKAVNNLLTSGMQAQLQAGDTIGVWTYNEQLYAGRLPLQEWSPQNEQLVASNILAFLSAQKFEKPAQFSSVWPALEDLIKESERMTVLLVSDGSQEISGTPFDDSINAFFKANAWKQKQKRMPFITVLRSYHGKLIGATLNLAPWPVDFPPFPPGSDIVAPRPKPKPAEKVAAQTNVPPPLIVIGKKPEPPPVTSPATSESAAANPVETAKPAEPTSNVLPPTAETKPATTANPQSEIVQPTIPPVTLRPPATAALPEDHPIQPKPVISREAPPPAEPIVQPSSVEQPTIETTPIAAKPEAKPDSPAAATPTAAAPEVKPEPSATISEAPTTTPPAQVAAAVQPEKSFNFQTFAVIGAVVLILVVVLIVLWQRHTRAPTRISLITRSMDQEKK